MERRLSNARRELLTKLLESTDGKCWLCQQSLVLEEVTIDHILPKSHGGSRARRNIAPAHAICNNRRSNRTVASCRFTRRALLENAKTGAWELPPVYKQPSTGTKECPPDETPAEYCPLDRDGNCQSHEPGYHFAEFRKERH